MFLIDLEIETDGNLDVEGISVNQVHFYVKYSMEPNLRTILLIGWWGTLKLYCYWKVGYLWKRLGGKEKVHDKFGDGKKSVGKCARCLYLVI